MDFVCSEHRHQEWLHLILARAVRVFEEEADLPGNLREDRARAVRAAFARHAVIAVRHPSPERRLRRAAFVAANERKLVGILERVHAVFWRLGLSAVERGVDPAELDELALFQTALTAVWVNNTIHRGTIYAENGRDILPPPLWQIRHVMRLLRDDPIAP